MKRPDPSDGVGRPRPRLWDPRRRVYPKDYPVYAILAGVLTGFIGGHRSLGGGMAMGLAATAFWLALGPALFRRRPGPMRPSEPDPWDPLAWTCSTGMSSNGFGTATGQGSRSDQRGRRAEIRQV